MSGKVHLSNKTPEHLDAEGRGMACGLRDLLLNHFSTPHVFLYDLHSVRRNKYDLFRPQGIPCISDRRERNSR